MKNFINTYAFTILLITFLSCGGGETPTTYRETTPPPTTATTPPLTEPKERVTPRDLATNEPEDKTGNAGVIDAIRAEYSRIEQLLSEEQLRVLHEQITCKQQDGHLDLTRYYEGDEVVMIKTITGIGHNFVTTRIYLDDGQPFFEYQEDENFAFGAGTNADGTTGTVSDIKETRLYLDDSQIIRKLEKSFKERSWENDPSGADVPNTVIEAAADTEYPKAAAIPQMMRGNVGC